MKRLGRTSKLAGGLGLLLGLSLIIALAVPALAVPQSPAQFYGSAKVCSQAAPAGTVVSARINGTQYGTGTVDAGGNYQCVVTTDDPDTYGIKEGGVLGDTVQFYFVGGGDRLVGTAPWPAPFTPVHLDLQATQANLTVNANPPAGGTATGNGTYTCGTDPSITAAAASGYVFANWAGAGIADPTKLTTTVHMDRDRMVTANFTVIPTAPPSVTTDNATSITSQSAQLNGNLTDKGTADNVTVSFQWGLTADNYTGTTPSVSINVTGPFSSTLAGLSANTTYHFRAKAVGDGTGYGNDKTFITKDASFVSHYDIPLVQGYNLISLPHIPTPAYMDPATMTGGLDFVQVAQYTAKDPLPGEWHFYNKPPTPQPMPPYNLTQMTDGWGYWINMSGTGTLSFDGYEQVAPPPASPPSYDVVPGWNLIGFKSATAKAPAVYLAGIAGKYVIIYGFDGANYFVVGSAGHEMLQPGFGYWLAAIQTGTIHP